MLESMLTKAMDALLVLLGNTCPRQRIKKQVVCQSQSTRAVVDNPLSIMVQPQTINAWVVQWGNTGPILSTRTPRACQRQSAIQANTGTTPHPRVGIAMMQTIGNAVHAPLIRTRMQPTTATQSAKLRQRQRAGGGSITTKATARWRMIGDASPARRGPTVPTMITHIKLAYQRHDCARILKS